MGEIRRRSRRREYRVRDGRHFCLCLVFIGSIHRAGREGKFFPKDFKCPICGADKDQFWDMNDPNDPRNQVLIRPLLLMSASSLPATLHPSSIGLLALTGRAWQEEEKPTKPAAKSAMSKQVRWWC